MAWQKARDGILAGVVLGALLLLPPILPFFDRPVAVFGMPLIVLYVFGVWLALIVLTWTLSRRLPRAVARDPPIAPAAGDGAQDERGG